MDFLVRKEMISLDKSAEISVTKQCKLLDLNRASVYYQPVATFSGGELKILGKMDEIFTEKPFYGYRRVYLDLINQGCQFTSKDFTDILKSYGVQISMDSKGRAIDNVIIERFFRSLKYEDIY